MSNKKTIRWAVFAVLALYLAFVVFAFIVDREDSRMSPTAQQGSLASAPQDQTGRVMPNRHSPGEEDFKKGMAIFEAGDHESASKYFLSAAEQGHAEAQYALGRYYDYDARSRKDKQKCMEWYRKAAEQGHAEAQYNLGFRYLMGEYVNQDQDEALKWIRKAAEQGLPVAQFQLGACYQSGIGGRRGIAEAVTWYRKAAEQGNAEAVDALRRLGVE